MFAAMMYSPHSKSFKSLLVGEEEPVPHTTSFTFTAFHAHHTFTAKTLEVATAKLFNTHTTQELTPTSL
jgi:hypothetical protein